MSGAKLHRPRMSLNARIRDISRCPPPLSSLQNLFWFPEFRFLGARLRMAACLMMQGLLKSVVHPVWNSYGRHLVAVVSGERTTDLTLLRRRRLFPALLIGSPLLLRRVPIGPSLDEAPDTAGPGRQMLHLLLDQPHFRVGGRASRCGDSPRGQRGAGFPGWRRFCDCSGAPRSSCRHLLSATLWTAGPLTLVGSCC